MMAIEHVSIAESQNVVENFLLSSAKYSKKLEKSKALTSQAVKIVLIRNGDIERQRYPLRGTLY